MCGIVGIVAPYLATPGADPLPQLDGAKMPPTGSAPAALEGYLGEVREALAPLRGFEALCRLLDDGPARARLRALGERVASLAQELESRLSRGGVEPAQLEATNRVLTLAKDAAWRVERDVLATLPRLRSLLGDDDGRKLRFELWRLDLLFQSLARLEVRGRDSSGLSVLVRVPTAVWERHAGHEGLALRQAVRGHQDRAVVVYPEGEAVSVAFGLKIAAEIGELGSNVEALRARIREDGLLRGLLAEERAAVSVFAHTRWASNGIINEVNAHPQANDVLDAEGAPQARPFFVAGSVNGDVDNYQALRAMLEERGLFIPDASTSDAKVIPVLFDQELHQEPDAEVAFRHTVAMLEGSLAVAAHTSRAPGTTFLALRGSGQGLYVGSFEGGHIFASELYGIVELTDRYHRLDGSRSDPARPGARGHLVVLEAGKAPRSLAFDGSEVPLGAAKQAPITTRDVDRANHPHFFLKEIRESPDSVRRTLRGRFVVSPGEGSFEFRFGPDAVPDAVVRDLREGSLRRIICIGQGTASIAAQASAYLSKRLWRGAGPEVLAMKSTELSGFELDDLGPSTLVVAVSQSGTTTDTNRTVDMVRERGARVLAIVNRRGSDLTARADGVIYTSSGRDVEMAVASTKAFYSQVVAGYLLGLYFASVLKCVSEDEIVARLLELNRLPELMERVLLESVKIEKVARRHAVRKRYWACVGSGPTRPAADEIRIKLSELCYKSIGCDTIEDKKHIDLSSEPLILVCTAGLSGSALSDAVKEIAIFKAHKACPIVIAEQGEVRFAPYAAAVLSVPLASEAPSLLLNTVAGHLFGYYSALAIDAGAQPLRRMRAAVEEALRAAAAEEARVPTGLHGLRQKLVPENDVFREGLIARRYDTGLEVRTATRLCALLDGALGRVGIDDMARWFPQVDGPTRLLELLLVELSSAIDQLKRPIDVIKHQAKTVTVGISRQDDAPAGSFLQAVRSAGATSERLLYRDRLALRVLGPLVQAVQGSTRYRVFGLDPLGRPGPAATIFTERQTGIAEQIPSRSRVPGPLKGTKRRVVTRRRLWLGVGKRDGRDLVILPLVDKGVIDGLLLLHVRFAEDAPLADKIDALRTIGNRYEELTFAVTEWDNDWDDALLAKFPPRELLVLPVEELARRISGRS